MADTSGAPTGRRGMTMLCTQALVAVGFSKRIPGILTRLVAKDTLGWVGLNEGGGGLTAVEINPAIGVRHQKVEKLLAEFRESKPHSYSPPTMGVSIGYLMPDRTYTSWLLDWREDPQALADRAAALAQSVVTYGLPFMEKYADLPSLVDAMRTNQYGIHEMNATRLPCALYLLGEIASAVACVDAEERRLASATYPAADDYRRFAARFRERVGASR